MPIEASRDTGRKDRGEAILHFFEKKKFSYGFFHMVDFSRDNSGDPSKDLLEASL